MGAPASKWTQCRQWILFGQVIYSITVNPENIVHKIMHLGAKHSIEILWNLDMLFTECRHSIGTDITSLNLMCTPITLINWLLILFYNTIASTWNVSGYHTNAKCQNKRVSHHIFQARCSPRKWCCDVQVCTNQGFSNDVFRWSVVYHVTTLHRSKLWWAFKCLWVLQYCETGNNSNTKFE